MTLTVALAILGAVVLAAVLVHGVWSARRAGPKQPFAPVEPREPLRIEPTLASASGDDALMPSAAEPAPRRHAQPRLDALIDAIVPLAVEQPIAGELALQHLPASHRAGSKPFFIEGLNTAGGQWEAPQPGQRYGEFQAGVQMANRGGAINEIEYSEFVQKVQGFADGIGSTAEPPDMLDVVARARELDAFAGSHDAQLAVQLKANGAAWSVGYLAQHAARHGFVAGAVPGRLVHPGTATGDDAVPVLTLSFDPQAALAEDPALAAVSVTTLAFDVPQTARDTAPFALWQQAASSLAADFDATLVDDAGRPLDPRSFESIGKELDALYAALQAHDLAAGSAAARRLFS